MLTAETEELNRIEIGRRMSKDIQEAAALMGTKEARFLVDIYYQFQHYRIATAAQLRSCGEEPNRALSWAFEEHQRVENGIRGALHRFAKRYNVGQWMMSLCGIGPVISAGLLAELDVSKCKTAGHFWRFAGVDPTMTWEKGEKRPWNARLKTLVCFKLGECFVKVQNNDKDVYGKIYRARKDLETNRNDMMAFRDQAAAGAERVKKSTEAYKFYSIGKLPPGHLHARARRYAVKIFMSHLHHVMHVDYFGTDPPIPYVMEHVDGDHRHFIEIPNWPFEGDGKPLKELLDKDLE